jgi:threonine dehydratase
MFPEAWIVEAESKIAPYINHTELRFDPGLNIYLKLENRQITGSFKTRGALNKILSLQPWEVEQGIVVASAGNHGQGAAYAGKIVNAAVAVFCPENTVPKKVQAMRDLGATIEFISGGYGEAESAGITFALQNQKTWVSPYNDSQVIAGQGTAATEVIKDLPESCDAVWIVPAGGGGLISGIGAAIKNRSSQARLIAVQSTASPFLHNLYIEGTQDGTVELPSIADGLAGTVEEGSLTIPLVKSLVDEFILIDEAEIEKAIAYAWFRYGEIIEGSAAVPLAAVLSGAVESRPAILLISGGNIQPEVHRNIIDKHRGLF